MLELLVINASLFANSHWQCVHQYDYVQHNVREAFVSDIHYANDLSYTSSSKIMYSHLDKKDVFAQFSYESKGVAHLAGNTFYLQGHSFNISKDFDHTKHFHKDYTKKLLDYLNTTLPIADKTLTVIEKTDTSMIVAHKKSGKLTHCIALAKLTNET